MSRPRLTDEDKAALLELARAAIDDRLVADGTLARARDRIALTPALLEPRAAFVTLKVTAVDGSEVSHRLRGCIGTMTADRPLHETVVRCALESAFGDPRFSPLRREELEGLALSLSVLEPPRPVDSPDAIVAGVHGVMLEARGRSAVFLPQVATEQGWDVRTLLEHLASKAGLPRDGWKGARLSVFEAVVFPEEA